MAKTATSCRNEPPRLVGTAGEMACGSTKTIATEGKAETMTGFKTVAAALATVAGLVLGAQGALAQNKLELNMATPWAGGHWLDIGAKKYAEIGRA
ncbi:hypothetical protein, partial [Bosea sp. (in: a-proteobacteria)]|uniref:hypothetical protein n=1 Tax=Bosea sp. (in: a-proteobacteria) TaxID=1871050 RepID=UPI0025C10A2A